MGRPCILITSAATLLYISTISASLPRTLMPTFYDLSLNISPGIENYVGTVNITFDVLDNQTIKDIYLNTDPNYIYIQQVLINNMIYPRLGTPDKDNILDVNFTLGISGENNFMYISFIGKVSTDGYGLVQTNYSVGIQQLFKIESQFMGGYASRAFPCLDEDDFKAKFSVTIEHPVNYTAITDTDIVAEDCTTYYITTEFAVTEEISPDSLYILVTDPGKILESGRTIPPRLMDCDYEL